jgi:quercetin dioxygenase-like cupin family protein
VTPIRAEPWEKGTSPSQQEIEAKFRAEGLSPSRWSNGPGDRYGAHSHSFHKVLYCVTGSITFNVEGEEVSMAAGDRLEIPPGTTHSAVVGPEGVTCMEAAR